MVEFPEIFVLIITVCAAFVYFLVLLPMQKALEDSTKQILNAIRPCDAKRTFELIERLRKENYFTSLSVSPAGDWKVDLKKGVLGPDGKMKEDFTVTQIGNHVPDTILEARHAALDFEKQAHPQA